jgi:hypothetical protein
MWSWSGLQIRSDQIKLKIETSDQIRIRSLKKFETQIIVQKSWIRKTLVVGKNLKLNNIFEFNPIIWFVVLPTILRGKISYDQHFALMSKASGYKICQFVVPTIRMQKKISKNHRMQKKFQKIKKVSYTSKFQTPELKLKIPSLAIIYHIYYSASISNSNLFE